MFENDSEKIGKLTKTVSFSDLAKDLLEFKPPFERPVKNVDYKDPYYTVLDNSYRYMLRKKNLKKMLTNLPEDIQDMLLELEGLVKDLTLAAVEDDFDFETQMNKYYFTMTQIDSLSSLISFKIDRFTKTKPDIELYYGNTGKHSLQKTLGELSDFAKITNDLSLSANLFMDHLERDYSVDKELQLKRQKAHERALSMMKS